MCKSHLDVEKLVDELQIFKAICQNENFIYFEDLRQHMQNHPAEDFIFIPTVLNKNVLSAVALVAGLTATNLKTWIGSMMLPA